MGVPAIPVITHTFQELVTTTAFKKGMPNTRIVYVPHPVTNRPADLCRKYIEGKDPNTGKLFLPEVFEGLTKPLSDEDKKTGFISRGTRPRLLEPNTAANLEKYFYANNYTDGLPIVMPTEERVAEMLKATSHKPDEKVATMRPSPPHEAWEYTVEMVAANAVMSGAKPEYFPTILALASTGVTSLFSSTSSFARMVVVNGPVVKEIDMNTGIGALGPFNRANSTIGRCWTLISKNLGGSGKPGETFLGSQGNPLTYNNLCFPETEDGLPAGWNPLHVQKGFKKTDSVVSVFSGWSFTDIGRFSPYPNSEVIRGWLEHFFSFNTSGATIIVDPTVATDLAAGGHKSKEAFASYLAANIGTPAWLYWQDREDDWKKAKAGVEPFAGYLKLGKDAVLPIPRFYRKAKPGSSPLAPQPTGDSPTTIEIIVTGGGTNTFWSGGDFGYVGSALVDKWR